MARYKAKQFLKMMEDPKALNGVDIELYFALVEKMTIFDGGRMIVTLLDGTDVECKME